MKKRLLGWSKQFFIYLGLAILMTVAVDLWRNKDRESNVMPVLSATSIQGEEVDLASLSKDNAVLVYYWASWCSICNFVSPSVDIISDYYPVVTVALSSGEDNRLKKYLSYKDYDFSVINDNQSTFGREWQVNVTPTIFIVKDGEIVWFTTGFTSLPGLWWRLLTA